MIRALALVLMVLSGFLAAAPETELTRRVLVAGAVVASYAMGWVLGRAMLAQEIERRRRG